MLPTDTRQGVREVWYSPIPQQQQHATEGFGESMSRESLSCAYTAAALLPVEHLRAA